MAHHLLPRKTIPISNYKFVKQRGQSLVEYLIIVAIVAIGALGVLRVVGHSINTKFAQIAKALGASVEGPIETSQVKKGNFSKRSMKNFMNGAAAKGDGEVSDEE